MRSLARRRDSPRRADEQRREREAETSLVELDSHVVVGTDGLGYTDHRSYGRKVRESLRAWNPNLAWPPKDLRNCLITFAEECGLQLNLIEQYIGHAAKSVSRRRRRSWVVQAEAARDVHERGTRAAGARA